MHNLLRHLLARLLWTVQCSRLAGWLVRRLCRFPYHGGRHVDWMPVRCEDEECGWRGPLRWCLHDYSACGEDDVDFRDRCPACGADTFEDHGS